MAMPVKNNVGSIGDGPLNHGDEKEGTGHSRNKEAGKAVHT